MLKIVLALLIFSAIIIFHELGHCLVAKKNGILVEEFAIGIGPTLIGKQIGETKYGIKLLPFGGCCMMLGEDGDSTDPRAFGSKSAAARFAVIFAGPFFNFILAFILSLFVVGIGGADPAVLGTVDEASGAYEAGLRPGDRIISLDGSRVYNFREITLYNFLHDDRPEVDVVYERDGKREETQVVRKVDPSQGRYIFGVTMTRDVSQGILGTFKYSFLEVRYQIKSTLMSLKYMIMGRFSVKQVSGPVGIVDAIGDTYEESVPYGAKAVILSMLSFAILLSANLGVMNLLPLPALDGGRLVFIILEIIRGKKIDPEKEGLVHFAGIVVLMALMVLIMANDIHKIIGG